MRKSLGMVLFVLISFAPLSNAFAQSTVGSLVTITGRCLDVDNVGGVRNGSRVQVGIARARLTSCGTLRAVLVAVPVAMPDNW